MQENPYLIAGTDRFDTDLMRETDLVVKGGAEGIIACGSPQGWGAAIKISDGSGRAVRPAALSLLIRQDVEPSFGAESTLRDLHGENVGEILPLV